MHPSSPLLANVPSVDDTTAPRPPSTSHDASSAARALPATYASDAALRTRVTLAYPDGWFAVCLSHELPAGRVLTVPFLGHDLVLYRTVSGLARAIDPYCPHLGAHLGQGGKVEGEDLICPFHGLAFGPDGACVRAPTGQKPPRATLGNRYLTEVNGIILVWGDHEERPPSWEPPSVDFRAFSAPRYTTYRLPGYSQDMIENSADVVHFGFIHGLTDVVTTNQADGPQIVFTMRARTYGAAAVMRIACYGIGYAVVETTIPSLGLHTTSLAAGTQTAPFEWTLRIVNRMRLTRLDRWPAPLRRAIYGVLLIPVHGWYRKTLAEDFPLWKKRGKLERPKLMSSEGNVAAFRRWVRQFYPDRGIRAD